MIFFDKPVTAKKSRRHSKDAHTIVVRGCFVFVGLEVPIDATGKIVERAASLLLHEVARYGKHRTTPYVGFVLRTGKTAKEAVMDGPVQLFSVPVVAARAKNTVRTYSFDSSEHRKNICGVSFGAALEMQLGKSPMTKTSRMLGYPMQTDAHFGDGVDATKTAYALAHSMTSAHAARSDSDYERVGALSKASIHQAMKAYSALCDMSAAAN